MLDLQRFAAESNRAKGAIQKLFNRLKKQAPKNFDEVVHGFHAEAFEKIDCLECANCCKTTSPIFYEKDIARAAKAVRMKPGDFVTKYLREDEDKDFVLKESPCAFLDAENHCMIYDARPLACNEYPHTDRRKVIQVLDLSVKNSQICPAVFHIYKRLAETFPAKGL